MTREVPNADDGRMYQESVDVCVARDIKVMIFLSHVFASFAQVSLQTVYRQLINYKTKKNEAIKVLENSKHLMKTMTQEQINQHVTGLLNATR